MKFFCIGDENTVRGFRLAGIEGDVVFTPQQAAQAVRKALANQECGIIILTQKIAAAISQQVKIIRLERERPLIVEIPGAEGPLSGRKGLLQFAQAAVGLNLDHQ